MTGAPPSAFRANVIGWLSSCSRPGVRPWPKPPASVLASTIGSVATIAHVVRPFAPARGTQVSTCTVGPMRARGLQVHDGWVAGVRSGPRVPRHALPNAREESRTQLSVLYVNVGLVRSCRRRVCGRHTAGSLVVRFGLYRWPHACSACGSSPLVPALCPPVYPEGSPTGYVPPDLPGFARTRSAG